MKFGVVMFVGHLKIGDVVRPIFGGETANAPAIKVTLSDGRKVEAEATRGWRPAPIGGEHDFRSKYDIMSVIRVSDEYVTFARPYIIVRSDGTFSQNVELVERVSRFSNMWYELLNNRPKICSECGKETNLLFQGMCGDCYNTIGAAIGDSQGNPPKKGK